MNHTNRNKTEEIYKISIPIINLVGEDSERPLRFNGIFVSVCVDLDVCLVKMFNFYVAISVSLLWANCG